MLTKSCFIQTVDGICPLCAYNDVNVLATAKFIVDDGTATGNISVSGVENVGKVLCLGGGGGVLRKWGGVVGGVLDRVVVCVEPEWVNGYENLYDPDMEGDEDEDEDRGVEEVLAGLMRRVARDKREVGLTCRYPLFWPGSGVKGSGVFDFAGDAFRHGVVREKEDGRSMMVVEKKTLMFPYLNVECQSIESVDLGQQIKLLLARNKL
jgi:hypothetical protein